MAIFHMHIKVISRGKGKSCVASAAYIASEKIRNGTDGMTHDYRKKTGTVHKEILTPTDAPAWVKDRAQLWNEVERKEKRIDAQLARELEFSLPIELNREQQLELTRDFLRENFVSKGMIADFALHNKKSEKPNPHIHVLLSLREIDKDGFKNTKNRDWNKKELAEHWRKSWAEKATLYLEQSGYEVKIDHRSYERQGIDKIPSKHLGHKAAALERRGIETEIGGINKMIAAENQEKVVNLEGYREQKQTREMTAGELLKAVAGYEQKLTGEYGQLIQLEQKTVKEKNELWQGHRKEAAQEYFKKILRPKLKEIDKEMETLVKDIEVHNRAGLMKKLFGDYNQEAKEMTEKMKRLEGMKQNINLDYKRSIAGAIRGDLDRQEQYEVDQLAKGIARRNNPFFDKSMDEFDVKISGIVEQQKDISGKQKDCREVRLGLGNLIPMAKCPVGFYGAVHGKDGEFGHLQIKEIKGQLPAITKGLNLGLGR